MADLTTLFLELMSTIIILVTKPFSLLKLACLFGVKTICTVTHTWIELFRATIHFHLNIFWSIFVWTTALISFPARVLTAIQRERLVEQQLHEIQVEVENLLWDRKELEDRLQIAFKERRMMESMLAELEDEHDKAIMKIELLEGELQKLKDDNLQLKKIQSKGLWKFNGQDNTSSGPNTTGIVDETCIPYGIPSWKSGYRESGITYQDIVMHRDTWEDENKDKAEFPNLLKTGSKPSEYPFTTGVISKREVVDERRGVAFSQSVFSSLLSLLVGMIIWEAEDPCMPLVVALFTVVGMSLKSVVQFFSTIDNKPASDAVALLSFNWFILGTLTYPTLPRVARMLSPLAINIVNRTVSWLGLSP